jgi:hypothetical protein
MKISISIMFHYISNKILTSFCSFFFFIHLFICAYIVRAISPSCPTPLGPSSPQPPHFQAEPVLHFSPREDISNNKKDKEFLLVEIRIAIQRDS